MVKFKKLGDLCYISSGGTPKRTITDYWDNGKIPWVKISDIKSKHILNTDERITKQGLENSSAKLFPKDTIVYTIFATVGEVGILDITAATNQAIAGIQVKDRTQLRVDYLYYFLKSIKKSVQFLGRGVAQNNINLSVLKSISVPIPSFQEQTAIVKVLDSLNGQIKNKHKQLTFLSQLIKARFVEMFGNYPNNEKSWPVGKIKDLVLDVRYGTSKKATDGTSGKYPYLRMNNITYDGNLNLSDLKTIDLPLKDLEKYTVQKGDLLFNRTNSRDLVGKTCVYDLDKTMVLAGFIIRVRLDTTVANPVFVSKFLNTGYSKLLLRTICKNASGQSNINAKEMQNIKIYVPPISLQNEFANFVQQVDKSKFENIVYLNKTLSMKILGQLGDVFRD